MKELKQLENYYKNNEIDIDGIIEDFTPYITKIINNGTNNDISFEDKEEIFSDTFFILWKNRNRLSIKVSLNSYIAGITRNLIKEKYRKLKNALEVVTEQKKETIKDLNYIESIIYELEYATSISDISSILYEISENNIFEEKRKNIKKNKSNKFKQNKLVKYNSITFNPLKFNIDGFKFLVGRNNK